MAEQYLINDTTLTSIADAIRETGWGTNIGSDEMSNNHGMLYSFRFNNATYSCLQNFLPDTVYYSNGYINQIGMPHAIKGILGVPNMAGFVARESLSGIVTLGTGVHRIRSYAFATDDFDTTLNSSNSVYKSISAIVMHDVEFIGDWAFQNCTSLRSLYIFGSTIPSLDTNWTMVDFQSQFSGTVYVPASMYDAYANNSEWSPSYHPPKLSSFYTASELGVRFTYSTSYSGNFNSSRYSDVTYGEQYLIDDSVLSSIASAIRGQLGVSTQYLPREMPSAIRKIGANDDEMISNIEGTIKSYSDKQSSVTVLSDYAFAYCQDLSSAVFPACTVIGHEAFASCTGLRYISAPQALSVDSYAFLECSSLLSASFSKCTEISSYAFYRCSSLTSVSFPECSWVKAYAFSSDILLSSVNLSKCALIDTGAFQHCHSLKTISLPAASYIDRQAFSSCMSLMSVYLMGSSVASLGSLTVFTGTPISSSGLTGSFGSVYVPTSLYTKYSSAAYWSTYKSRLVSM